MGQALSDNQRDALLAFVVDLEQHYQTCDDFFDYNLLDLLGTHFHYSSTGITAYDNSQYLGCIGRHRAANLVDYHTKVFHKQDVLSRYITSKSANLLASTHPIVRATDLFSSTSYANSDYSEFLMRAGLKYVAVMVFPNHRICIYKETEAGDFTADELELIAYLYRVIRQKSQSFANRQKKELLSQAKSGFFDLANIAYYVFDKNGNVLDANESALHLAISLFSRNNLQLVFADICEILGVSGMTHLFPVTKQYKSYSINLNPMISSNGFGLVDANFFVTITQSNSSAALTEGTPPAAETAPTQSLTAREKEVLTFYCNGSSCREIAQTLFISENTVRSHLKSIYRKLDVTNQRELYQAVLTQGYLTK